VYSQAAAEQIQDASGRWQGLLAEMKQTLAAHGIRLTSDAIRLSPVLEVDVAAEKFVGDHADAANRFLKREYREPFVVPEIVA